MMQVFFETVLQVKKKEAAIAIVCLKKEEQELT